MFVGSEGVSEKGGWRRLRYTCALIRCLDSCRYVGVVIGFHAHKSLSLLTVTIRENMF